MWKVVDIRATPSSPVTSYNVQGGWEHAVGADSIAIYNGTAHDISVRHAPCQLTGATRIAKGATGTYDHGSLPWVKRLESALEALAEHDCPAIAVMDAPPPEHVYEALNALEHKKDTITGLKGTDKLLLLCGRDDLQLPIFGEGTMTYSGEPWKRMRTYFSMFLETPPLVNVRSSLEVPLALLLGTHQASVGPSAVHLAYPEGATVPVGLVPFIQYSSNVRSPRVSTTSGIVANAADRDEVWAKVVVEISEEHDCATAMRSTLGTAEDPILTLVRQSFSSELAEQGAAYFQLREVPQTSPLHHIATTAMQRIDVPPRPFATPPLARLASIGTH